jgi:hypothetical protein
MATGSCFPVSIRPKRDLASRRERHVFGDGYPVDHGLAYYVNK